MIIKKREKQTVEQTPCQWVDYRDGVSFELYGLSHPLYVQAYIKLGIREAKEDLLNLSEDANSIEQYALIIGQYLVKDWKGIKDEDGEDLECTADHFVDLLTAEEGLMGWILDKSREIQEQHANSVVETKKKPSKGGNTKG